MKAPLTLNSAIEKVAIVLAFLPLVFMVYPEFAAAAYVAQNKQGKALVFEIDSKSTSKLLSYDELAAYHARTDIPTILAPKVKAYLIPHFGKPRNVTSNLSTTVITRNYD